MKKILAALALAALLSGCAVYSDGTVTTVTPVTTYAVVEYEPAVIMNGYYLGYYRESFGYWTGHGWDMYFYDQGHIGYGHYYRGAPRHAREYYHRSREYDRPRYEDHDRRARENRRPPNRDGGRSNRNHR